MLKGLRMARLVREKPVTITELANVIGVAPSVMGRIEREQISLRYRDAQLIASYMGIPVGELG